MAAPSPSVPCLRLKPNARARAVAGHPWVFANEVTTLLPADHDGTVVECRDRDGRLLGTGIYNSRSQICWRRLDRGHVTLDATWLRETLARAVARRPAGATTGRLVWSEADGLPGVVVDRFDDVLVVQVHTLAMDRVADTLGDLLAELVRPREIVFRNDASIRRLEGLPQEVRTRSGRPMEPHWVTIDGFDYWLDLAQGQKTGFYLDQREQHRRVAAHVAALASAGKAPRVLDAFCNQGSFALHAARAGAATVRGIDLDADAVALARRHSERAGLPVEWISANVFDYFTEHRDETWDVIVLDPPPFAKSRSALAGALRGYKEINLRALQRLTPGGLLATYTCSHHVQDAELRQVLAEAAADARRRVHIVEFAHQPTDHPVLVTMPESEYLRGYILRAE